ncbi:hypothetical protein IPZ58_20130 [Streptomyces roseoverticillatus]|uniref:DUF5682 family protein n=1 Tax=Streptomyces roseoverticillatus TaxID=66429 RepID=UPI001F370183|nr:DUF5682 family protein [Streptomyces roseoverticillatus]MCF3103881.1 hypothetical protein [Streptomyces roseoverticillatus]
MSGPGSGPFLLGIRHHGPGSARAVRAALEQCRPAAVLVEGPPEADAIVHLADEEGMQPPVALLAHASDDPGRAAFWPLAEFSPEWVAIRWALAHGVPVRFIDLPATHTLALGGDDGAQAGTPADDAPADTGASAPYAAPRLDPLAALAAAAGYDDPELWWEDAVEHRRAADGGDALAPFVALAEAMAELRTAFGDGDGPGGARDLVREAHMRLRIRDARRQFGDGIAVVCGAWHVPALTAKRTVTADRQALKGLPKVRTELSWVPWTHRRLSRTSGYGAGIDAPGWYGHLFHAPDRPLERWLTKVARLLRDEDFPVSSAHVIEAVRLAGTLAALRGRPLAGLTETTDAVRAVMCDGSDVPLALVRDRLVVGNVLGEVPDTAPATPLQRDLARLQRSLRLKPEADARDREFDLRKDNDAARSHLLHRLRLLGVDWGEPVRSRGGTGTFRESWRLTWEPELAVRVAEASAWGTTVLTAATARAEARAAGTAALADVTALAEHCLLADLPDALPTVMRALADRAALDTDVAHLAEALPALVRSVRYGDVRRTDTAALGEVAEGLAERVFVGLPAACAGLDADAAATMRGLVDEVHQAVSLLDPGAAPAEETGTALRHRWAAALGVLAGRDGLPGGIRGRAVRLLLDDGLLPDGRAARLMGLALSAGTEPAEAAAWIEGFLGSGGPGGMLLVHDERLLALVDDWLTGVPAAAFAGVLPLLRRTFSSFDQGTRRAVGQQIRRGGPGAAGAAPGGRAERETGVLLDEERAAAVLPTLHLLLGMAHTGGS